MDNEMMERKLGFEITKNVEVSFSDIDDLMCVIIESGYDSIGYWGRLDNSDESWEAPEYNDDAYCTIAAKKLWNGEEIVFEDIEDGCRYHLTLQMFLKGIKMYFENDGDIQIINDGSIDMCEVDATAGDMILQYALFGEQVFG